MIVSNHGGRQLDHSLSPLRALPAIAERIEGDCEIVLDGGVRRGTDIIKAIALGALRQLRDLISMVLLQQEKLASARQPSLWYPASCATWH